MLGVTQKEIFSACHESLELQDDSRVSSSHESDSVTWVIKILNKSADSMTRIIKLPTSHERLDDSSPRVVIYE